MRYRALLVLASVVACGNSAVSPSDAELAGSNSNGVPVVSAQGSSIASAGITWTALYGAHGMAVYATPVTAAEGAPEAPAFAMADAHQATLAMLDAHKAVFGITNATAEFGLQRAVKDELGMTHVRLQQKVGDVPVLGRQATAHYDALGHVTAVHSHYAPGLSAMDTRPTLAANDAQTAAFGDFAKEHADADPSALVASPAASLVVFAPEEGEARLGYAMSVRSSKDALVHFKYVVDAHTGAVLQKYDNLQAASGSMDGMGAGVLGDMKKIEVQPNQGSFRLVDFTRTANGIVTLDAQNSQDLPGTFVLSQSATTGWDSAAVDAHAYAGLVYDYYKKVHARTGIDGADGRIISTVHFSQDFNNAFWNGDQMIYGDGDGTIFREFTAGLDVIAHELTHGVTQNSSALAYQGQTGALNESVSDIFGAFVEHMFQPDPKKNWIMGDRIALGQKGTRDYIHPANGGPKQPAHMNQLVVTQQDNGGVHINSGITNNAMFLMTMGGTNDVSKTVVPAGIGWDKAEALWYRANTHYFMESTDFAGAAQGTLTAAKDLMFTTNEQAIVECAWIATGVITGTCKAMAPPPPATPPGTVTPGGGTSGGPIAQGPSKTNGGASGGIAAPGQGTPVTPGAAGSSPNGTPPRNAAAQGLAPASSGTGGGGCSMGGDSSGGGDFVTATMLVAAALGSRRGRKKKGETRE